MSDTIKDTKTFKTRFDDVIGWYRTWGKWGNTRVGRGKFYKRILSKARRRWEDPHRRGLAQAESEVNWRGH